MDGELTNLLSAAASVGNNAPMFAVMWLAWKATQELAAIRIAITERLARIEAALSIKPKGE